jgi:eukaryotic-like serine/threonine-protein kinase
MTPSNAKPDAARDPVEELAEAFLERYRRGERPAVGEFVAQAPEHADEIRDLFPALVLMEQADPAADSVPTPTGHPERIGDYRLIREVGRGGMGVVYEAEQEALGRHVALKVLPIPATGDVRALARFRREARSAARLHHTNIVPVFDVGERAGVHYYAMQFITGQGLDEVIAELRRLRRPPDAPSVSAQSLAEDLVSGQFRAAIPDTGTQADTGVAALTDRSDLSTKSDFHFYRSAARIGLQVAEALAYAHGQRVLHRDIKPSNLLLDARGCAWVTDFGLAKEEGDTLTGTGDVVGTLRYLAPERLNGLSDARSDVYSLGLTLYELLVLRPAFTESDRVRLVQRISRHDPVPPRKLDPHLPRDLETIVLTAIAKEPGRRYATAGAMAEDLRRFLADRPVRARRASRLEYGWRWCRRNPGWAATMGTVLGLLLVIAVGGTLLSLTLRRTLTDLRTADREKADRYWQGLLERARALRSSGRVGQRFGALEAIREAAAVKVTDELRDEAVAALVIPDVEMESEWEGFPPDTLNVTSDAKFDRYARISTTGEVTVCRRGPAGEEVLARVPSVGTPRYWGLWMSPDGQYLAYGHSAPGEGFAGSVRILRLDDPVPTVLRHAPANVQLQALAFHPDGRHLAVGDKDGVLWLYDLETAAPPLRQKIGIAPSILAFNPKDGRLAANCGLSIRIFDGETLRELSALRDPTSKKNWELGLAWHPEGRLLVASGEDMKLHVWDTKTGTEVMAPLDGHLSSGVTVTFNHAGDRLLSTSWGLEARLWDAVSGRLLLTFPKSYGTQFGTDDATIGLGREGARLAIRRLADGRELRRIRRPRAADRDVLHNPVLDTDGRILAACSRLGPVFFDVATGRELAALRLTEQDTAYPISFDRSDGWMTCGRTGLLVWPSRADPARPAVTHIGPPRFLHRAVYPGADATPDGRVRIVPPGMRDQLDTRTDVLDRDRAGLRVLLGPQDDVRHAAISPDGKWAATCSWFWDAKSPAVRIWDAGTGQPAGGLPVHGQVWARFSPDGKWLATNVKDEGSQLWEVGTWQPGQQFPNADFQWSPDGRFLLANDVLGAIRFVNPTSGREAFRLTGPEAATYTPRCISADGATLVTLGAAADAIDVWDLRRIRAGLRELHMDWDMPEFPPATSVREPAQVELDAGLITPPPIRDDRLAVAAFSVALAVQPINADAYYERGSALYRQLDRAHELADYETFLALTPETDPRRILVQLRTASIYYARKDMLNAKRILSASLSTRPEHVPLPNAQEFLCNAIAWSLAGPPGSHPPAGVLNLAQRAADMEPFNYAAQNTLGVVLYRLGRFDDTIRRLDKNLELSGKYTPFDLFFLAMSYQHLGQTAKAQKCFEQAVAGAKIEAQFSADERAELAAFRAEAEKVLGDSPKEK